MQVSSYSCTLHGGVVVDGLSAVLLLLVLDRRPLVAVDLLLFLSVKRSHSPLLVVKLSLLTAL